MSVDMNNWLLFENKPNKLINVVSVNSWFIRSTVGNSYKLCGVIVRRIAFAISILHLLRAQKFCVCT
jgi:hypothetical protein